MKKTLTLLAIIVLAFNAQAQKKKTTNSKPKTATISKSTTSQKTVEAEPKKVERTETEKVEKNKKSLSSSDNTSMGFRKDDIAISGTLGYTSNSTSGSKDSSIGFLPSVIYFVKDNIALGGTIGYKSTTSKPIGGGLSSTTSEFVIGAFGRYYMTPASQFSLFGQGGIEFASQDYGGSTGTRLGLSVKPGLNYFVSPHFSIEATVGEVGFQSVSSGGQSNSDFNLGVDFSQIGFGLNYKF